LEVIRRGWSFSTDYSYVDNTTKVSLICDNKQTPHKREINPTKFQTGQGCKVCKGLCPEQAKKDFEAEVKKRGWSFPSDYFYKNPKTNVNLICDKAHKVSMQPQVVKRGSGCIICSGHSPEQAKEDFEAEVKKRGWSFANDYKYIKSTTNVSLICNKGHSVNTKPSNFKQTKVGCLKCAGQCPLEAEKELLSLIKEKGWKTAKDYCYKGAFKNINLLCDKGHLVISTPHSIKGGTGCIICWGHSPEQAKKDFETKVLKRGWSFSSDYKYVNSTSKVSLVCSENHPHKIAPSHFKNDRGCPTCSGSGFDPTIPAFFYIQSLSINKVISSYKFGITNLDPKIRMNSQARDSNFDHKLTSVFYDEYGYKIQVLETELKQRIERFFVDSNDMPDGHTETISSENLNELLKLINKYKKETTILTPL
jgi:hypothetical protein